MFLLGIIVFFPIFLYIQVAKLAEDVFQAVEQVTKEKDAIHKEKIETLASLENSRQTNQKLQNEVITLNAFL